ncbi:hypothetical protein SLEP1_g28598 [Rubroshorea leprosula]|uniref:Uncharacterized protein n=1 Tax=Rubroshorea leprosula TaxID=152421 RepID=A0AAV5JWU0_9ROSI|nr:hypothetical protein SLEP1_g28598 [Rubroshorea leprosula]
MPVLFFKAFQQRMCYTMVFWRSLLPEDERSNESSI